jgi:CBS domain-containing protein
MQATPQSQSIDLKEPVRTLLAQKGNTLWSISPEATVYHAIERMSEKHVGALVVLSGGRLTGIITERDYARKVILKGRQSRETRVHEILSAPVSTSLRVAFVASEALHRFALAQFVE